MSINRVTLNGGQEPNYYHMSNGQWAQIISNPSKYVVDGLITIYMSSSVLQCLEMK